MIVENVVGFEVAAALVERYVGTSLPAILASMAAIHDLNRKHLAENWASTDS